MRIIGDGGHASEIRALYDAANYGYSSEWWIFIAVGDNANRKAEAKKHDGSGYFPILVHPHAWVSGQFPAVPHSTSIGDGTVIMAGAVVQPRVTIGKHCIINTCASVSHDCTLGDFVHVAPGARLCGNVTVGEGALIGAGAVCVPGAVIAPWSLVKAGSVAK